LVSSSFSSTNDVPDLNDLFLQAREHQFQKRFQEAVGIYKFILASAPESKQGLAAVVGLLSVFRDNGDPAVLSYLETLIKRKGELQAVALMALANGYVCAGNTERTLATLQSICSQFPQTEHEKQALIQTVYVRLFNLGDKDGANIVLSELESKFADDKSIQMARWLVRGTGGGMQGKAAEGSASSKQTVGLKEGEVLQNYPNPFNPITTISYRISSSQNNEPVFVSLKVYNILGREVATLVEAPQRPGAYNATFYGNRLASGVYFYKLSAGNVVEVKRMLLVK